MFERSDYRNTSDKTDQSKDVARLSAANVEEDPANGTHCSKWFVQKLVGFVEESKAVEGQYEERSHEITRGEMKEQCCADQQFPPFFTGLEIQEYGHSEDVGEGADQGKEYVRIATKLFESDNGG